jgi:hypothetical protein
VSLANFMVIAGISFLQVTVGCISIVKANIWLRTDVGGRHVA